MGKIGTDIGEGKCTWLIVNALARADASMLATLHSHYGLHPDPQVQGRIVRQCYTDLGLPELFDRLQHRTRDQIYQQVEQLRSGPIAMAIRNLADRVFFRQK